MTMFDRPALLWPLVEALERLPCLADQNDRNMLARLLKYHLGPLQIEEYPKARWHLLSIVEACCGHPDGLSRLLQTVGELDQGSIFMRDVRRIILEMTALGVWSPEERDEIFTLLDGVVFADVVDLYREVGGPEAPPLLSQASLVEALLALETVNASPDGLPKPLVFLEHLAARIRHELAIELRRWSDRQGHKLGLSTELQAVRRGLQARSFNPPPNSPAYLVVLLQYHGVSGDQYRLGHWRQLDPSKGWHPERGPDFVGSIEQVKRRIAQLIEDVESDWAQHKPDIRIEVVLPSELVNLPVDQWPWETVSASPVPMGCHYAVVVRSLERMRTRHWHRAWHIRWDALMAQLSGTGSIAPESVCWGSECRENALRTLIAEFETDQNLVSILPSEPPQSATRGYAELMVGLRAGLPVMLWHRVDCGSADFVSTVRELLHGDGPETVLQRTKQLRVNAYAAGGGHVGDHLSLLWDDPSRIVTPVDAGPPEGVSAA